MSSTTTLFSVFSFLTFCLVCIPLPWHLEAWNTGTCLYMFWTALALLSLFINSIIWADNAIDFAPVWCDISSRIIVATSVAIPAASLCINRRLYKISAVRSVTRTRQEKHRAVCTDMAIGLGLPLVGVALQYIVQGHRYDIYEEVGCYPYTYNTPPAYILVWAVPLLIGAVSGLYSVLSIRRLHKTRTELDEILAYNKNLNRSRFFRLMALSGVEVLCCIPLSVVTMILNATRAPISPWISWEDTHYGFSRVDQIPAMLWRKSRDANIGLEMTRWLVVVCGLVFFAFFGFAEEAQRRYKVALDLVFKSRTIHFVSRRTTTTLQARDSNAVSSTSVQRKILGNFPSQQSFDEFAKEIELVWPEHGEEPLVLHSLDVTPENGNKKETAPRSDALLRYHPQNAYSTSCMTIDF